ncbi:MAG: deazaflavin-dependent nitroreductase family protein [Glaciihabitans sp.]|nr:deazaflavin-dependent nitroreductase family protein [Glaciihabitans sp.]
MRFTHDGVYIAVASAAGATSNPSWYANLVAHPRVRVQDGAHVSERIAREVHGEEKAQQWVIAESLWPYFSEYRERAGGRDIPVFGGTRKLDGPTRPRLADRERDLVTEHLIQGS